MRRRRLLGPLLLPGAKGAGRCHTARALFCACALLAAAPCPARAEGPGFLLGGRIVVHPGLATELRYDSNIFFTNARVGGGLPAGGFILRILPSIDISSLSLRRG